MDGLMRTYAKLILTMLFTGVVANAIGQDIATVASNDHLAADFVTPPEATKPRCFWYWINGYKEEFPDIQACDGIEWAVGGGV